jgi:porin
MSRNALLRLSIRHRFCLQEKPCNIRKIRRRRLFALGAYLFAIFALLAVCPQARADALATNCGVVDVGRQCAVESDHAPLAVKDTEQSPSSVLLHAAYIGEVRQVADGGLRRGTRYLDNLDVTLTIDADRAFGRQGMTIFVHGLYGNGREFSQDLVGDIQGVSNIETGVRAARLHEAWVEQRFLSDRATVKVGLYDLNTEFDTIDAAGLFLNSSHGIGHDFSQTGRNGPSIFPVTSLAIRGDYRLSDCWTLRAAILDGVPGDPDHSARTAIHVGGQDGALLIGEIAYADEDARLSLGSWRYTAAFDDLLATVTYASQRRDNAGAYFLAERRLTHETDGYQGLSGWVRLGLANDRINPVGRYLGAGIVYLGPWPGRDADEIGVAIGSAEFGEPYRRAFTDQGRSSQARELSIETSYRAPITPWLTLQPDIQYVIHPGGEPDVADALVLGLRAEIGF